MKNGITLDQVRETVASWSILFREAGYTPDELEYIARQYHEDLVDVIEPNLFDATMRMVRRRCRYFPKVADIFAAYHAVIEENRPPHCLMLDETTSRHDLLPEEIEKDRQRMAIIRQATSGEITFEEATERLTQWAEEE